LKNRRDGGRRSWIIAAEGNQEGIFKEWMLAALVSEEHGAFRPKEKARQTLEGLPGVILVAGTGFEPVTFRL
jgi:hypothetical protein